MATKRKQQPPAPPLAAAEATPPPRGVHCPKCHCRDVKVVYTRGTTAKRNLRRRECRRCKSRFYTTEQVMGQTQN